MNQGHISLSKETYDRLREYCELNSIPMARIVERLISQHLDAQPENLLDVGLPVEAPPVSERVSRISERRNRRTWRRP